MKVELSCTELAYLSALVANDVVARRSIMEISWIEERSALNVRLSEAALEAHEVKG